MDRDTYDKKWKLGPYAKKKDDLKQQGKLDKYGRVVDKTPEAWKMLFGDSEKATTIADVAQALGGDKPKEKKTKDAEEKEADDSEPEKKREKKKDKKDKDKKDKKEKKAKKSKKAAASDDDSD